MSFVPVYRKNSAAITEGPHRAGARAMLKAVGLRRCGACASRSSASPTRGSRSARATTTCATLAEHVKQGIREAGGTPMEFNTVSISDGITMGSTGMRTSLISREVIADSIELVGRGNCFDAVVALCGCDKTIPGTTMAVARLGVPGLVLYGGADRAGHVPRPRRHDSGRLRGHRRACGRQDDRRRAEGSRGPRVPRRRRLRRPVHRQHHGDGDRVSRHRADGQRLGAGHRSGQGRGRPRRPDGW